MPKPHKPARPGRRRTRQKGVAILLALGLLALLIVFAMSFAASSLYAKRMAELSDAIQVARIRCDDSIENLLSMIANSLSDNRDAATLYPAVKMMKKGTGDWDGYWYTVSMVSDPADAMTDGLAQAFANSSNSLEFQPTTLPTGVSASWLPIYQTRTMNGNVVNVMTRRYAFIMVDESGKLDPNVLFNSSWAIGAEPVYGRTMDEIDLSDTGLSSSIVSGLRNNVPSIGEWFSRYHIANVLNLTQSQVNSIIPVVFPYRQADTLESRASYYDLTTVAGDNVATVVDQIAWLRNWATSGESGHFSTPAARAKNLAANIIDYSDTNYSASNDYTPADATKPTYFGTEKVPYMARLQFHVVNSSYNSGGKTYPRLSLYFRPELVNTYDDLSTYTNTAFVHVDALVEWKNQAGFANSKQVTLERTLTAGSSETEGVFTASGYIRSSTEGTATNYQSTDVINGENNDLATDITIKIVRAYVQKTSGGDWWDYSRADASTAFDLSARGDDMYVEFKALSPIQNFFASEWESSTTSLDRLAAPFTSDATYCPEWWSTHKFWIRNNTMQHIVEMGAILRMEPFDASTIDNSYRTFNLVDYKYNGDPQVPGLYSDAIDGVIDDRIGDTLLDTEGNGGDRNLLDMVRVGTADSAERIISGRININTQRRDVLNALYKRIATMSYTGGATIDPAKIDAFITALMSYTAVTPIPVGIYSNYRNPPIYGLLFQDAFTDLPWDQREYLLVMTEQLISAEHNFFSAIVAAQVIKDVGAIAPNEAKIRGINAQLGRYDAGADEILSQQRMFAVFYRNAFNNRVLIERLQYLDE